MIFLPQSVIFTKKNPLKTRKKEGILVTFPRKTRALRQNPSVFTTQFTAFVPSNAHFSQNCAIFTMFLHPFLPRESAYLQKECRRSIMFSHPFLPRESA